MELQSGMKNVADAGFWHANIWYTGAEGVNHFRGMTPLSSNGGKVTVWGATRLAQNWMFLAFACVFTESGNDFSRIFFVMQLRF